jgi:asparagine synthase (glutamine-hydrolysing)
MAHGIEGRLPFCDYKVVNFALSLPPSFLIGDGKGKLILRDSFKSILPTSVFSSRVKIGFSSEIDQFIQSEILLIREHLLSQNFRRLALCNDKRLIHLLHKEKKYSAAEVRFIFRLLSVKIWYDTFFEEK